MWPKLYTKLSKDSTCVTWLELFFTYVEIFAVIKRRKRTSGFNRHILLRANYHGNHSMHLAHNLLWEITLTDTFAIRLSIEQTIR